MRRLTAYAATLNPTPLDWERNLRRALAVLREARALEAGIVCLPELCLTGYGCEDAFLFPGTLREAESLLAEVLPETRGLVAAVGLPVRAEGALFDAAALLVDGHLAGVAAKRSLANDGLHYEPRWFRPWPAGASSTVRLLGADVPMGDLVFDVGGVRVGFEICEDAWAAERPASRLGGQDVDVILNPSASHFAFGKHTERRRVAEEGSRALGCGYVYANLVGNEAGRVLYDGATLVVDEGRIVAEGPRLGFATTGLTGGVLDLERARGRRAGRSSHIPQSGRGGPRTVTIPHRFPELVPPPATRPGAWEDGPRQKEEELARAVALGLFDHLEKSGAQGFVLSISGGCDSAAVAALVRLMVAFAAHELGLEGLRARLSRSPGAQAATTERELTRALLLTAYQATRQSGEVTRRAARAVAEALGAHHVELDVGEFVERYEALTSSVLGRPLAWETDDTTLQNLQARARAPGIWALANARGALLLATGNRSEAAVGYATMDGDTAGGLAPIAGVDKAYLRRWLRWLETEGPAELGPIPALAAVNAQEPTAELRPASAGQTDEKDLMPYEALDVIERALVRDRRDPEDILAIVLETLPHLGLDEARTHVTRFFRLFCQNQWKRERYAPGFHLDDESLDPRGYFRFPIFSGGYARELGRLAPPAAPDAGEDDGPGA